MDFEVSERMEVILTMVDEFVRDEVIPLEGEMLHGSPEELARRVAAAHPGDSGAVAGGLGATRAGRV